MLIGFSYGARGTEKGVRCYQVRAVPAAPPPRRRSVRRGSRRAHLRAGRARGPSCLRRRYAMSGTHASYGRSCLPRDARCPKTLGKKWRKIWSEGPRPLSCYAASGTGLGCAMRRSVPL
eukprot:3122801-Rhodomonas_salina.1